jgi:hypothetical protein
MNFTMPTIIPDITQANPVVTATAATVPDWLMGCWRRRSITFADGSEESDGTVIWLQTASHYADLRIPAGRIDLSHRECLQDCTIDELIALAHQQSSGGICELNDGRARWRGGLRFHAFDAWPEAGDLRRVGSCLIEFAESGTYVEDWRLQDDSGGPFISCELVAERDPASNTTLRNNGLLVRAGRHAVLIRDRAVALPRQAPLAELVLDYRRDKSMLVQLLDLECSYARCSGADNEFVIYRSTLPFREGWAIDGFGELRQDGTMLQTTQSTELCWRLTSVHV